MRYKVREIRIFLLGLAVIWFAVWVASISPVRAQAADPLDGLAIAQLKVTTTDQFIVVINNGDQAIEDLSKIQLVYYNNFDRNKATSSKLINLSGNLPGRGLLVINDGTLAMCFQALVSSINLGLSTTSGTLELVRVGTTSSGGLPISSVRWASKNPPTGVQQLPASGSFLSYDFASAKWLGVQAGTNNCDWVTLIEPIKPLSETLTSILPIIKPVAATATAAEEDVNQNQGLKSPEITELMPNPKSPQTDAEYEFIELYNPNAKAFKLSGYRLEAGISFSRGHTFSEGNIGPKSYASFSIKDTKLQLTNTEGQVRFLAPSSDVIAQTAAYEEAPDGESFSLINDNWQWTNQPTPGTANKTSASAMQPGSGSGQTGSGSASVGTSGSVAGAATGIRTAENKLDDAAPLHPLVLAGVGASALAYALYEYRRDVANRIFQLRRYLKARRESRAEV